MIQTFISCVNMAAIVADYKRYQPIFTANRNLTALSRIYDILNDLNYQKIRKDRRKLRNTFGVFIIVINYFNPSLARAKR